MPGLARTLHTRRVRLATRKETARKTTPRIFFWLFTSLAATAAPVAGYLLFWLDDEVRSPACMYCKPGRGPDSHSVRYERVLKLDQPSFARMLLSDVLYCTVPPLHGELSL